MSERRLWTGLTGLSLFVFLALWWIHQIPSIRSYADLSWIMLITMFSGTVILFYIARRLLNSSNKYAFIRLIMVSVLAKIAIVMALFVGYYKIVMPQNRFFVFPFLGIYLIFTIFETIMMYSLSQTKQST